MPILGILQASTIGGDIAGILIVILCRVVIGPDHFDVLFFLRFLLVFLGLGLARTFPNVNFLISIVCVHEKKNERNAIVSKNEARRFGVGESSERKFLEMEEFKDRDIGLVRSSGGASRDFVWVGAECVLLYDAYVEGKESS